MNQHAKIETAVPAGVSPEEWQARTDLAAVYRLCAHYGWGDVIYNHCSMRVPGEPSKFLMKQHELLWTEVTASNLRKVDMNDDLDEKAGVNRPGFTLHGGVLKGRPDVNCAVHVHTEIGMAIAGLKHGLRMVSQQAIRFYNRIGYHPYEGITEDFEERAPHQPGPRPEPRADPAQSRPADGRQERARGLRADEDLIDGGQHPAQDGGDRRRADRNSFANLREGRPRSTRPTTAAAARPTGRPILRMLDQIDPGLPELERPAPSARNVRGRDELFTLGGAAGRPLHRRFI